jgi:hypothetical protein
MIPSLPRHVMGPVATLLAIAMMSACTSKSKMNPSFPLSAREARDVQREMRLEPKPLARPLLVFGGIHDPGVVAPGLARRLLQFADEDTEAIAVSFFGTRSFEACRRRALAAVESAWPSLDPDETIEVDVVAVSMGGLVARYAARPRRDGGRRLKIRRLYTISTPHRGADMAWTWTTDARIVDMRAGSAFLTSLNQVTLEHDPEIFAYARLGDTIVGIENTAPPGGTMWWVPNLPLTFAHLTVSHDPRIVTDIARRLRGERPFSMGPGPIRARDGHKGLEETEAVP